MGPSCQEDKNDLLTVLQDEQCLRGGKQGESTRRCFKTSSVWGRERGQDGRAESTRREGEYDSVTRRAVFGGGERAAGSASNAERFHRETGQTNHFA